jgi:uncharacterized protein (TIRG00374 family)
MRVSEEPNVPEGPESRDQGPGLPTSTDEPATGYVRHPADVLRLVAATLVVAFGVVMALVFPNVLGAFDEDVAEYAADLPNSVAGFLEGFVQLLALLAPVAVAAGLAVRRRLRALGYALLAAGAAALIDVWLLQALGRVVPAAHAAVEARSGWLMGAAFPGSPYLAGLAAVITVLAPWMARRWRHVTVAVLGLTVLARATTGHALPGDLIVTLGLGWLIGSAVLVAFGTPNRRAGTSEIGEALARAGVPVTELAPAAVDARGSTPYFATTASGRQLFVKVLGTQERSADLLFRMYRWLLFRDLGDRRPFSSLRRTVEHEALCALAARDVGVRTPRLVTVADVGTPDDDMLLSYERIAGRSLDDAEPDDLTDEVLRGVWGLVADLQRHRIAHRDLRLANLFLDDTGTPWLIDFGFSELAGSDVELRTDVAQLLASTAMVVGVDRATRIAVSTLGAGAVGDALPRMLPAAFSSTVREALEQHSGALDQLRSAVQAATGVDDVHYEQLERVRPGTILGLAALGLAVSILYAEVVAASGQLGQLGAPSPGWTTVVLILAAVSYVGATIAMLGSVPDRLAPITTFQAQLAATFANRITPAQAGGYAVNIRMLQKQGVATAAAVAGVGVDTVAGAVIHVPLAVVFVVWVGSGTDSRFDLPSLRLAVAIVLGFAALTGVLVVIPSTRRFLTDKVVPPLRHGMTAIRRIAEDPAKLLLLLGGSLIVTTSNLLGLAASVEAFGGGIGFAQIGLVYLLGSAVGQLAPTPGGLGAVEAALTGGLTAAGLNAGVALAAVLLFRLATYWLPAAPGWLALRHLRATGAL